MWAWSVYRYLICYSASSLRCEPPSVSPVPAGWLRTPSSTHELHANWRWTLRTDNRTAMHRPYWTQADTMTSLWRYFRRKLSLCRDEYYEAAMIPLPTIPAHDIRSCLRKQHGAQYRHIVGAVVYRTRPSNVVRSILTVCNENNLKQVANLYALLRLAQPPILSGSGNELLTMERVEGW